MQPFSNLLEENIKTFSKLNKNVEDMIKLLSGWLEKNRDERTSTPKPEETSEPPKNHTNNAEDEKGQ